MTVSPSVTRDRAESFGAEADRYERTRPGYPDAMIADLLSGLPSPTGPRVLDVGCGTGKLGRLFVARGCAVVGVEPDARMAEVARRFGLELEVGRFETWDPAGRSFDLVVCGQAWHWIDPELGAARAAAALAPGVLTPTARRYPWDLTYTREQWLDLLPTHSDHAALAPAALAALLAGVADAIDRLGGAISVHCDTIAFVAVRR